MVKQELILGEIEGDICNEDGCEGVLEYPPVKNCTCFLSPPCYNCVHNLLTCSVCGREVE